MFAKIEAFFRRAHRRLSHREWAAGRRPHKGTAASGEAPGLLLIQVDALSRTELERAISRRRMPFVRGLLRRGDARLHSFYPGLPSTTSAVQAELYYGVRAAVPAFNFYDRIKREHGAMSRPDWAKDAEAACAAQARGLLEGGSSWSNIYTGGAGEDESHFCVASIGFGDMWRSGKVSSFFVHILLHPLSTLLLVVLMVLEFGLAVWDVAVGVFRGERLWPELKILLARMFLAIGLREFVTRGAAVDIARGLPVVHVNLIGYDEHAHRRGPDSAFAHWSLLGIDRSIHALYRAAEDSTRRDYSVWIFSDHGQERVRSFDLEREGGIEKMVHEALDLSQANDPAWKIRSQRRPLSPRLRSDRATERHIAHWSDAPQLTPGEESTFTVAAMGPLAHVYFARPPDDAQRKALAVRLVKQGVPGALIKQEDNSVIWVHAGGETAVPAGVSALLPHPEPVRAEIGEDLAALARHTQSGDLVLLGWSPGTSSWSFAPERGAHAGFGPEETRGFVLLPPGIRLPPGAEHHIRPAAMRTAALHLLERAPLASFLPVPAAGEALSLRVLTYNTHACAGMDGRVSPRRIARVIAARSPDLVALQELDLGRRRSRSEDQARIIAQVTEMHMVFCPTITQGEEHYGHALLCRWPIEIVRRAFLPTVPGKRWLEPRAALWARVAIGSRRINVITTHLGLGPKERRLQMEALLGPEWIGAVPAGEDVVLCGDFNAMPGSVAYCLAVSRLRDAQVGVNGHRPLCTFSATQPFVRIDHVFVSGAFVPRRISVPRDRFTRVASDHFPLVVDFSVGPSNGETPGHNPV